MTKDIQRILLQACARFIGKKIEPITREVEGLRVQVGDAFTKTQADELRREWDEKYSKPGSWFDKLLLPIGEKGEPGRDADPVDVAVELIASDGFKSLLSQLVGESIASYFEANPVQHGRDGLPGEKGEPGQSADQVNISDVATALLATDGLKSLVDLYVAEAAANISPGRDGQRGEQGPPGDRGERGADGVGMASALIDRDGSLVVTMTDGQTKQLGLVVGKDGACGMDGKDGADGLGFDDCDVTYDGDRTITVKFQSGDKVKERSFHVPTIIDRGYWREGIEAEAGDAMTHDGTLWIALRTTKAKPARESADWRIGARKGRDGLQGPPGKEYRSPEPVKLGPSNG